MVTPCRGGRSIKGSLALAGLVAISVSVPACCAQPSRPLIVRSFPSSDGAGT